MMGERRIIPSMPQRRKSPALYELIGSKSGSDATVEPKVPGSGARGPNSTSPAVTVRPAGAFEDDEKVLGLSPGRVYRVPVGYMLMGITIVLAAVFASYMLGYSKKDGEVQRDRERKATQEASEISDPAKMPVFSNSPPAAPVKQAAKPPVTPPVTEAAPKEQASTTTSVPGAGKVTIVENAKEDPRTVGLNYLVVATQPIKEARETAAFLAGKGIDMALVPVKEGRLFQVTVVRGFEPDSLSTPEYKAFEKKIRDLGKAFKRDVKSAATDFSDMFPNKCRS